jgi:hypothetical protein
VCTYGQACVEQQDAAVGPGREEAGPLRRRREGRVVSFEALVDVLEGRRGGCRWADGEAEAVSLVGAVVRVLAEDDCFNSWERCMARPGGLSVWLGNS